MSFIICFEGLSYVVSTEESAWAGGERAWVQEGVCFKMCQSMLKFLLC